MKADFTRTCAGCDAIVIEPGPKGEPWNRCFEDGPFKGYVVGINHFLPYIPAWCPRMIKNKEVLKNGGC